jgi:outer membrane protein OmpA-like peptidoglycan-associated protein
MKRILFAVIAICISGASFAQKNPLTRGKTMSIHFFLQDFSSGRALDTSTFSDILDRKEWYKPSRLSPGFAVDYGMGLLPKIDLRATLSGSFEDYLFKNRSAFGVNTFLGEFDVSVNLKAVNDKHWVIPYINAGVGASYYKGYVGAIAPVGLGLQINLFNDAYIDLQSQMRLGITDNTTNHFYHSLGVIGNLGASKKKDEVVVTPPILVKKDADNDGITDDEDECPNDAGTAALKGCPDKDGDGIADKNDNCPTKPGVEKYQGCPVPDSDGDGINDEEDKCPNQAGVSRYQGCPIPDGDGDGINDEEDKCPTVPGVAEQQGCPAIKEADKKVLDYAAKNILFETGSARLKSASNKGLNDVIKVLVANPDVNISIDGYTDNTGTEEKNMVLSQNRADAVKAYFLSKGVDEARITATGHGQEDPVADNATVAGRAKNRRVELKLSY